MFISRTGASSSGTARMQKLVRDMGRLYIEQIAGLSAEIEKLDKRIAAAAMQSDVARQLQRMPGIGPVRAMAITTFAPDMISPGARLLGLARAGSPSVFRVRPAHCRHDQK